MLSVPPLALVWAVFGVFIMRPVRRARVRKSRSARAFRRQSARTKSMNLRMPMRGGFRI